MLHIKSDQCVEGIVHNRNVSVAVCSCVSREHPCGVVDGVVRTIVAAYVGLGLHYDVIVVDLNRVYSGSRHQGIFSDKFWSSLIGPVHLVYCMAIRKGKQELTIHVIRIDTKLQESRVCSISSCDDNLL